MANVVTSDMARGYKGVKRSLLIVALDVDNLEKAKALVEKLYPLVKIFKIGSQLFTACGPEAIKMVHKEGARVFLDLKFHDIPNTVAKAVKAAKDMGVFMINVHASGGKKMLEAAVSARGREKTPLILAVTVLTSLDTKGLRDIGIKKSPLTYAEELAYLAKSAGLDGVVCSAGETAGIRRACGSKFIIVTPGIRPPGYRKQDQKRIATPEYALRCGADYIVVGRPITKAKDPLLAAKTMLSI